MIRHNDSGGFSQDSGNIDQVFSIAICTASLKMDDVAPIPGDQQKGWAPKSDFLNEIVQLPSRSGRVAAWIRRPQILQQDSATW